MYSTEYIGGKSTWHINLNINDTLAYGLLDTGAGECYIRKKFVPKGPKGPKSTETTVINESSYGGHIRTSIAVCQLKIFVTSREYGVFKFFVFENDDLPEDFVIGNEYIWTLVSLGLPLPPKIPKVYVVKSVTEILGKVPDTRWFQKINVINSRLSGRLWSLLDTGSSVNLISKDLLECAENDTVRLNCWTGIENSKGSVKLRIFNDHGSVNLKAYINPRQDDTVKLIVSNEVIWAMYHQDMIGLPFSKGKPIIKIEILSFQRTPELSTVSHSALDQIILNEPLSDNFRKTQLKIRSIVLNSPDLEQLSKFNIEDLITAAFEYNLPEVLDFLAIQGVYIIDYIDPNFKMTDDILNFLIAEYSPDKLKSLNFLKMSGSQVVRLIDRGVDPMIIIGKLFSRSPDDLKAGGKQDHKIELAKIIFALPQIDLNNTKIRRALKSYHNKDLVVAIWEMYYDSFDPRADKIAEILDIKLPELFEFQKDIYNSIDQCSNERNQLSCVYSSSKKPELGPLGNVVAIHNLQALVAGMSLESEFIADAQDFINRQKCDRYDSLYTNTVLVSNDNIIGDLTKFIQRNDFSNYENRIDPESLGSVVKACKFLWAMDICYIGISPENILVRSGDDNEITLILKDLSHSVYLDRKPFKIVSKDFKINRTDRFHTTNSLRITEGTSLFGLTIVYCEILTGHFVQYYNDNRNFDYQNIERSYNLLLTDAMSILGSFGSFGPKGSIGKNIPKAFNVLKNTDVFNFDNFIGPFDSSESNEPIGKPIFNNCNAKYPRSIEKYFPILRTILQPDDPVKIIFCVLHNMHYLSGLYKNITSEDINELYNLTQAIWYNEDFDKTDILNKLKGIVMPITLLDLYARLDDNIALKFLDDDYYELYLDRLNHFPNPLANGITKSEIKIRKFNEIFFTVNSY